MLPFLFSLFLRSLEPLSKGERKGRDSFQPALDGLDHGIDQAILRRTHHHVTSRLVDAVLEQPRVEPCVWEKVSTSVILACKPQ